MLFAAPLWLLALIPWAGWTLWLLLARRQRVAVPFVALWRGPIAPPRARPALARPPIALLLLIIAVLCAALAAARPRLPSRAAPELWVIIDRGITMSPQARLLDTCRLLADQLNRLAPNARIHLQIVPAEQMTDIDTDASHWLSSVEQLPLAFSKSEPQLDAELRAALDAHGGVIIVSDQSALADPRICRVQPQHRVSNLTITTIAARALPRAQVMVKLRDQNAPGSTRVVDLKVESDGRIATRRLLVPQNGQATAFIDLPSLGADVSVTTDAADDFPADNQAWLARGHGGIAIDIAPGLPESLQRMIEVYRRHREGGPTHVAVVTAPAPISVANPSVLLAPSAAAPTSEPLTVQAHPLTAGVDFAAVTASTGGTEAPPGFEPLVSRGRQTFLALRQQPTQCVWVCLNSKDWSNQADYVVFWTNVFDFLAGDAGYRWYPVEGLQRPGIQTQPDGSIRAFNAMDVTFADPAPNDWAGLAGLIQSQAQWRDLTPILCLAAIALATLGMVALARQRSLTGRASLTSIPAASIR
jgi:hypothetical protein